MATIRASHAAWGSPSTNVRHISGCMLCTCVMYMSTWLRNESGMFRRRTGTPAPVPAVGGLAMSAALGPYIVVMHSVI